MTERDNITKCELCNCSLIAEEMNRHVCFKIKHIWVIDGCVWIGDKGKYYRWYSPNSKHPNFTPDDSTEP